MNQPCPEDVPPIADVVPVTESHLGGWMLLGFVVALIVIDGWLAYSGKETMSAFVQRKTGGKAWWKVFGLVVIGTALWHMFFGFPW